MENQIQKVQTVDATKEMVIICFCVIIVFYQSNFTLFDFIIGCAIWGGGHLSEQVSCLGVPVNTFFVILYLHTYCWLFFIYRLFILLLFVLSNKFDLI